MGEREWDSSVHVAGYRQPLDASGSVVRAKSKVTPWSHERRNTQAEVKGRHDDSVAVKTKGHDAAPSGRNGRDTSRTVGQLAVSEERREETVTQPSGRWQSLYGGLESVQDKLNGGMLMGTARREDEIGKQKHMVGHGRPLSGVVTESTSGQQSLIGPLSSLMKENAGNVTVMKTSTTTSGSWTAPMSDFGSSRKAASEASVLSKSQYQRALWEQTRPADTLPKSRGSSTLSGFVAHRSKMAHEDYSLSRPAVSMVEPLLLYDDDYPDKVSGAALDNLTKEELVKQCRLSDKLLADTEKHKKEMGDQLKQQHEQAEATEEENSRLREKAWRLEEENTQLRSTEVLATGIEESMSRERSHWEASALLQMVTILYTCQVHDFAFIKMIAHGCEGAVFLARCQRGGSELFNQTVFALKVMFNVFGHSTFTQVRTFYKNEYQALCAMIPHQNIVRLYAFFYDRLSNDVADRFHELPPIAAENARTLSLFLVMEHIPTTLEQTAADKRKEGRLTAKEVMQWTLDILTGIEHLLKHHYLHRDLKLNNILVSNEGILKLCDFGCSIQLKEDMALLYSPGSSLGGNPAHIPPELLNAIAGSQIQCGSQDLWACGVLVYEMAAGDSPFTGLDQRGYRMSDLPRLVIKDEKFGEVSEESMRFPECFVHLVVSLLEFEPSKRPSVGEAIAITKGLLG